jgi:hypothetical protein
MTTAKVQTTRRLADVTPVTYGPLRKGQLIYFLDVHSSSGSTIRKGRISYYNPTYTSRSRIYENRPIYMVLCGKAYRVTDVGLVVPRTKSGLTTIRSLARHHLLEVAVEYEKLSFEYDQKAVQARQRARRSHLMEPE